MDLASAIYLIYAEGSLGIHSSKTATSALRYIPERVSAVIDSNQAGRSVGEVLGIGGDLPVVSTLEEGLSLDGRRPTALLIGTAPRGGRLAPESIDLIARAAAQGLDIVSGLHQFLTEIPAIREAAEGSGATLVDLRRPPADLPVATGLAREVEPLTVQMVGTDCNLGKMTAAFEIRDLLKARGERVAFAPTGQTGIMIEGWGIAVDAVVSDFIAGAAETLVLRAAEEVGPDGTVMIEGQGAIFHPGYSGVTLGLLHGSLPDTLILCHDAARTRIRSEGVYDFVNLPPLAEAVRIYEEVAGWLRPAPVIGIALKTNELSEDDALAAIRRAEEETGLPTTDPVRFGAGPLADAISTARAATSGRVLEPVTD